MLKQSASLSCSFGLFGLSGLFGCMGARSVTDKILASVFPITAFVTCGFEHSVANMYVLPIGVALAQGPRHPSQSLTRSAISRWSRSATSSAGLSSSRCSIGRCI